MWRAAVVAVLVLFGGCTGLLASDGSAGTTVTPAPVPETETARPVDVPRSNGTVDIDRVFARHRLALANRSYHLHVEQPSRTTLDVWADRDAGIVRVQRTVGRLVDDLVRADGTVYTNVRDDPDDDYRVVPSTERTPLLDSLTGAELLRRSLHARAYRRVGTVQRGGRTLAVLSSNDTEPPLTDGDPDQATGVESRVYVDQRGVVRRVDYEAHLRDGRTVTITVTVRTGIDRIPVPWWLESNDPYTSGSM